MWDNACHRKCSGARATIVPSHHPLPITQVRSLPETPETIGFENANRIS
ncbi:hypothetical protein [Egbenema bharatensis]